MKPSISIGDILSSLKTITLWFNEAKRGPPPNSTGNTFRTSSRPKVYRRNVPSFKGEVNTGHKDIDKKIVHSINLTSKSDLDMKAALRYNMIGITHYPENLHNIQDKLWVFGINFIKVKAITSYKFLLLFEDKETFDQFDTFMVHPIFRDVKYTEVKDVVTMRLAKLKILGLPIFA